MKIYEGDEDEEDKVAVNANHKDERLLSVARSRPVTTRNKGTLNSDRAWSDAEEVGIVLPAESSSFDVVGYEDTSIPKKELPQVIKRQVHYDETRMTLSQSKKPSQPDNAIWEDQQLLKSGVAIGTEMQIEYDNEEEQRVTLLVHGMN
ncbi:hypothetical protein Tco_1235568 [Tanacetum coccineum]